LISYDPNSDPNNAACRITGGAAPEDLPCLLWQANYGHFQVAYGCDPSKTKPVWQQTEQFCYWNKHGGVSAAHGCQHT
jgi:hypothetical protein